MMGSSLEGLKKAWFAVAANKSQVGDVFDLGYYWALVKDEVEEGYLHKTEFEAVMEGPYDQFKKVVEGYADYLRNQK